MRIEPSVVNELVANADRLQLAAVIPADYDRMDVPKELTNLRLRLGEKIDEKLQPWFILLDESVQFFVQFERFLYQFPLGSELMGYAVMVSKLKRDILSIRELLAIGQDMTARVLARTFIEDIEIAMALALSADTCRAFASTHDTNEFWNKNIGYGKVYDKMSQYLLACGVPDDRAGLLVDRHREAKKMFSESTHGGRTSSLFSAFSPTLSEPDRVNFLSLGALTYVTAELALFVAQETHAFAGSVVNGTMHPRPLHLYDQFVTTGRFMNAAGSAYVLQELLLRYEDTLQVLRESL